MAPSCSYAERIYAGTMARSLVWSGDDLIDWAGGGSRYLANGTTVSPQVYYAYSFDAAVTDQFGEFTVIYARLGTKALLLKSGKMMRELNRSYYHADVYEYPVALVRFEGRALLVHCPNAYNQLMIEDAATGEVLTARTSKSADFFHSRLAVSPGGRYLLSAGWVWHPLDAVTYYDLEEALRNPGHLDSPNWAAPASRHSCLAEESSACWMGEGTSLLGGGSEPQDDEEAADWGDDRLKPNGLAYHDVQRRTVRSACLLDEPAGTMMPVGSTHVMAFYQHPRLIRLTDGLVEFALPWIGSGVQLSSILHSPSNLPPPLALDPERRRFAVAQGDGVHVVTITLPSAV